MAEFKVIIPDRKYLPINKIIYADQVSYVPSLSPKTETNQEEDVGPLKLVLKSDNLKLNQMYMLR
ncbi:hypothetical protein DOY81_012459 [Sarcophaga bullata]|nr:hypothetical protein DOY81_012459 [Sarcophaga bullata]